MSGCLGQNALEGNVGSRDESVVVPPILGHVDQLLPERVDHVFLWMRLVRSPSAQNFEMRLVTIANVRVERVQNALKILALLVGQCFAAPRKGKK